MLKLIITGTGRCGTTFMAKLITSMGINCGHESVFDYSNDDVIKERIKNKEKRVLSLISQIDQQKWIDPKTIEADASYMAAPCLDWPELSETKIIHVVRNPLNVIRSFLIDFKYFAHNHPDKSNPFNELEFEEKIWRYLPKLSQINNALERVCYFYCEWNRMIEKKSTGKKIIRIKIEKDNTYEILDFLNLPLKENLYNKKNENTFLNVVDPKIKDKIPLDRKVFLSDIPEGEIKNNFIKIMKEYGY